MLLREINTANIQISHLQSARVRKMIFQHTDVDKAQKVLITQNFISYKLHILFETGQVHKNPTIKF
jgi:hypothetical protein